MEVYSCGITVKTKFGNIEGVITGITIRFDAISYEVSYFNSSEEYKAVWLNEIEFTIKNGSKKETIGFKNGF